MKPTQKQNLSTVFSSAAADVRRWLCFLIWHRISYTPRGMACQRCDAREGTPEFINTGYLVRPLWAVQRFFYDLKREDDGLTF